MPLYLTFSLSKENYALAAEMIDEISAYPSSIATVPMAPPWVRGVFNLRGSVIPAIDLGAKLGLPVSTPDKRSCLLIARFVVDGLSLSLGLIVDAVTDMVTLETSDIEPPPPFGSSFHVRCFMGTARRGDAPLCIIDLQEAFRSEELLAASLDEARARAALTAARAVAADPIPTGATTNATSISPSEGDAYLGAGGIFE